MNRRSIIRKFTLWLIVLLTLASAFSGCTDENNADGTQGNAPLPTSGLVLVENGVSDYVILRSASAEGDVKDAAYDIKLAIKEKCGISLDIVDEREIDGQKAICVGALSRDTVTPLAEGLGYHDYVIAVSGKDVVICGGNAEQTAKAAKKFISEFLSEAVSTLTLPKELLIEQRSEVSRKTVKLGGASLEDYSVVVYDSELDGIKNEAELLKQYCVDNFAFSLNVVASSVKETEKEIIIGTRTGRKMSAALTAELADCKDNQGLIYFEGTKVWLVGNSDAAVREAIIVFREEYIAKAKESGGALTVSTDKRISEFDEKEYTVMSFNILYGNRSDGTTPQDRKNAVITQIRETAPDILGVQECTEWWYGVLCEALGNEYGVVGELNNPSGQRWRNAIFYRKDKFELIDTKTQWLSRTPDVVSKFGVSPQYRILTYTVLKDRETGKTFAHCNTHMGFEEAERSLQWNALIGLLDKIEYPIVVTGDFNTRRSTAIFDSLQQAGYYESYNLTRDRDSTSTLDFCFCSIGAVHVKSHDILTELVDGVDPSDHDATVVKFYLR